MRCWIDNHKILVPALLVSAALNVVFAGYLIGTRFSNVRPSHDTVVNARINSLLGLLPKAAHKDVRAALEAENTDVKAAYKAIHIERRHIHELLAARHIEENELREAFAQLRQHYAGTQKIYHDAFTTAIVKLPYAERMQIKQKMRQRYPTAKLSDKQAVPPIDVTASPVKTD